MIDELRLANAKMPTGEIGKNTLLSMNENHSPLTKWALSKLNHNKANNILDIGCGGGATIEKLHNIYENAFIYGIDYSMESVKLSKEHNQHILNKFCSVEFGDVHSLPYNDNNFDIITAFETIYFWKDIKVALSQVNRILKDDGVFLICCEMSDVNNPKWSNALNKMNINSGEKWKEILENNNFIVDNLDVKDEWICLISHKVKKVGEIK